MRTGRPWAVAPASVPAGPLHEPDPPDCRHPQVQGQEARPGLVPPGLGPADRLHPARRRHPLEVRPQRDRSRAQGVRDLTRPDRRQGRDRLEVASLRVDGEVGPDGCRRSRCTVTPGTCLPLPERAALPDTLRQPPTRAELVHSSARGALCAPVRMGRLKARPRAGAPAPKRPPSGHARLPGVPRRRQCPIHAWGDCGQQQGRASRRTRPPRHRAGTAAPRRHRGVRAGTGAERAGVDSR